MALVKEQLLYPAATENVDRRANISVLYTTQDGTIAALRTADALAGRWNARVTVIAPQVVPFPRQLADPPVQSAFHEWQLGELIRQARVETTVQVYLCRDPRETLLSILAPHSVVVLGSRRRWWRTAEERLAAMLRQAGHDVIVTRLE